MTPPPGFEMSGQLRAPAYGGGNAFGNGNGMPSQQQGGAQANYNPFGPVSVGGPSSGPYGLHAGMAVDANGRHSAPPEMSMHNHLATKNPFLTHGFMFAP